MRKEVGGWKGMEGWEKKEGGERGGERGAGMEKEAEEKVKERVERGEKVEETRKEVVVRVK